MMASEMARPAEYRQTVREAIQRNARLDPAYLLMNTLATVIACYGLLANSPAVVIGAMIIAMLLNPILGVALGLAESSHHLTRSALLSLLAGVGAVYAMAFIIGLLYRQMPVTNEMMARTAPNSMDLMIAIAGGSAGAYATVSPRLSVAFVGVAIATALVPPLSTSALLLARGEFALSGGALVLALTNIVAIQFASSVVMWLSGFRGGTRTTRSFSAFLVRDALSLVILIALGVVLSINLQQVVARQLFETKTRGLLRQETAAYPGAYLVEVRFDNQTEDHMVVRAVVRGPQQPTSAEVAKMEQSLPQPPNNEALELRLRYVATTVMGRDGPLFDPNAPNGE